jgi:hypothetical protein
MIQTKLLMIAIDVQLFYMIHHRDILTKELITLMMQKKKKIRTNVYEVINLVHSATRFA